MADVRKIAIARPRASDARSLALRPGTKHAEIFAALAAPFPRHEVKERTGHGGQKLRYITGRMVMNRLDEVLGPENWRPEYEETRDGKGLKCRLWIRIGGDWLAKEDGGGYAEMKQADDTEKSGYSDALKRAAVVYGIGRYLYGDGMPDYVRRTLGLLPAEDVAKEAPAGPVHDYSGWPEVEPQTIEAYKRWRDDHIRIVNERWRDWKSERKVTSPRQKVVNEFLMDRHVFNWARQEGWFEAVEVERVDVRWATVFAAAMWRNDAERVTQELALCADREVAKARRDALGPKHPAPDPDPEEGMTDPDHRESEPGEDG